VVERRWKAESFEGDGREDKGKSERGYSRFTFFDIRIFVTASEGEELIVDIITRRHGESRFE
jgi:hypothetical protein